MLRPILNHDRKPLAVAGLLVVVGCGVDVHGGLDRELPRLEQRVWMSAAEGGEIILDDGAALRVPAGALAADGDVTFTREACGGVFASDSFRSCLYQVDGESDLVEPFSLQLPPSRESNDGSASCIARQMAPNWPCVAAVSSDEVASDVDTGLLAAKPGAFSSFAARAAATVVADGRVDQVPFDPADRCAGPIEGRWEMVATTATANRFYHYWREPDPFAVCDRSEYYEDRPFASTQRLEFARPKDAQSQGDDGLAWVSSVELYDTVHQSIITMSCMRRAGERCGEYCERNGDLCECLVAQGRGGNVWSSPWWLPEPGWVHFGSLSYRYCVEGDRLTIEYNEEIDGAYIQVYERQP